MKRSFVTVLAVSLFSLSAFQGCAARMNKSYFQRWSEQDAKRRTDDEREDQIRQEVEARMKGETPKAALQAPATKAPAAAATDTADATDTQATEETQTAPAPAAGADAKTSSPTRVVKPAEEEEVIY